MNASRYTIASVAVAVALIAPQAAGALPGQTVAEFQAWSQSRPDLAASLSHTSDVDSDSFKAHGTFADVTWTYDGEGVLDNRPHQRVMISDRFSVTKDGRQQPIHHDGTGSGFAALADVLGPDVAADFQQGKFIRSDRDGKGYHNLYVGTKYAYFVSDEFLEIESIRQVRALGFLDPPLDQKLIAEARALLAATPHLQMFPGKPNGDNTRDNYGFDDSDVSGYFTPEEVSEGTISTGQRVLIVPLATGGTMQNKYALLYATVDGAMKFVGYVPSPNGHLLVEIRNGDIEVDTPIYGDGDPNCCPGKENVEIDTLDGIKLVKLRSSIVKN